MSKFKPKRRFRKKTDRKPRRHKAAPPINLADQRILQAEADRKLELIEKITLGLAARNKERT